MKQKITLLIILSLILTGCFSNLSQQSLEYSSGLVKTNELYEAYGYMAAKGNLYFGNPEDGQKIYQLSLETNETKKISDAKVEGMGIIDEYLYYKDSEYTYADGPLKRIRWNQEEEVTIIEEPIKQYIVTDEYLFYEQDQKIVRSNLDGTNRITLVALSGSAYELQYKQGQLYFSTNHGIYRIKEDGSDLELLLEGGFYKFTVYEDYLVYSYNEYVQVRNLDTGEETLLLDRYNYELYVYDGALYYTDKEILYKKDITTKEEKAIYLSTYAYDFFGVGDWIYCFGDGYLWKMDKDLNNKEIVYGKGKSLRQNMVMVDKEGDYYLKGYDFNAYENNTNYLYAYDDKGLPTKLISDPVGETLIKDNKVYYINKKNQWLYAYDLEEKKISLILDQPMEAFTYQDEILYYREANSGHLFSVISDQVVSVLEAPVSGLKAREEGIYYINTEKSNRLYCYHKGEHRLVVDDFLTEYAIVSDKIYYRNESEKGQLYLWYQGKRKQLTDQSVEYIYQSGDEVYYVASEGTWLLYAIDSKTDVSRVIKFMGRAWLDYLVYDDSVYEVRASENNGLFIKVSQWDDTLELYSDEALDNRLLEEGSYLLEYENYLYRYERADGQIQLLYPYPIQQYERDGEWLYITGDIDGDELRSYIKRLHLSTGEIETMVTSQEIYTPPYEFALRGQELFYTLSAGDEKGRLYGMDMQRNKTQLLTEQSLHLIQQVNHLLIYEDKNHGLRTYNLETGEESVVVQNRSEYIASTGNTLIYYEYRENSFEGWIKSVDLITKEEQVVVNGTVKAWDYTYYNDKLYYVQDYLYEMTIKTQKIRQLLSTPVDHFYIHNKRVIAYSEPYSVEGKIIELQP